jgi:hypothetical protein
MRHAVYVGGPADGQHEMIADDRPYLQKVSCGPLPPVEYMARDPAPVSAKVNYTVYRYREFCFGKKDERVYLGFYAPVGMTDQAAFQHLVQNYCGGVREEYHGG